MNGWRAGRQEQTMNEMMKGDARNVQQPAGTQYLYTDHTCAGIEG